MTSTSEFHRTRRTPVPDYFPFPQFSISSYTLQFN